MFEKNYMQTITKPAESHIIKAPRWFCTIPAHFSSILKTPPNRHASIFSAFLFNEAHDQCFVFGPSGDFSHQSDHALPVQAAKHGEITFRIPGE